MRVINVFVLFIFLPLLSSFRPPPRPSPPFTSLPLHCKDNSKNDNLSRLKDHLQISTVIKHYIPETSLSPEYSSSSGSRSNQKGLCICPFHDDTKPSLHFSDSKQVFKCFACGVGGDIYRFVSSYHTEVLKNSSFTFSDTLKEIDRTFIAPDTSLSSEQRKSFLLPSSSSSSSSRGPSTPPQSPALIAKLAVLQKIINAAHTFYVTSLTSTTTPSSGNARYYIRGRGLTPTISRTFGVGFAPSSGCIDFVRSVVPEATEEDLVLSGVGVMKEVYSKQSTNATFVLSDKFKNRMMIPIFVDGVVKGFGGRYIPGDYDNPNFTPPKYLNSPESPIFKKRDIVFGLDIVKNPPTSFSSSSPVFITEGYLDAIAMYAADVPAVATMGTSLTMSQITQISKLKKPITFFFDNDAGGRGGVLRFCEAHAKALWDLPDPPSVLFPPSPHNDPQEYIDSLDSSSTPSSSTILSYAKESAKPFDVFIFEEIINSQKEDKDLVAVIDRLTDLIILIPKGIRRTSKIVEVAESVADILNSNKDSSSGNNEALRIRIEEDLIQEVNRKERDSLSGRIADDNPDVMKRLLEGGRDDDNKSSRSSFSSPPPSTPKSSLFSPPSTKKYNKNYNSYDRPSPPTRRNSKPHFSGIEFQNPTDAQWLGKQKALGMQSHKDAIMREGKTDSKYLRPFYFNSEPVEVSSKDLTPQNLFMIDMAERRLLKTLIKHSRSRSAMKAAIAANFRQYDVVNIKQKLIEWSSSDREWLFNNLVGCCGCDPLPITLDDGGMSNQIREHLIVERGGDKYEGWFEVDNDLDHLSDKGEDRSIEYATDATISSVGESDDEVGSDNLDINDDEYYANFGGLSDDFFGDSSLDNFGMEVSEEEPLPTAAADIVEEEEEKIDPSNPPKTPNSPPTPKRSGTLDWFFEASGKEEIEHFSEITEKFEKKLAELTVQETLAVLLHAGAIRKRDQLLEMYREAVMKYESYEEGTGKKPSLGLVIQDKAKDLRMEAETIGNQLQVSMRVVLDLSESCRRISARVIDYATFENREFQTNSNAIEKLEALLDEQAAFVRGIGEMEYLDMQFDKDSEESERRFSPDAISSAGGKKFIVRDDATGSIFKSSPPTSGSDDEKESDDQGGFE
mmetsp:Transcript_18377/g.38258  ORF Transcript_18377/g.38258 Transcript_18377/m.38258 type:complete len:1128 (-) Transcript_18377:66-3449(-)|eukprot:CAMPEP_0118633564 /NCGR_PEP_ID=MMETSP0785-20121206/1067_1 /TAXON_ID=91992 /ORGANISM="Bolidomonas pacifica, Strain CCMP 1866" /LENGTH=1127 /DNA_ID=CAMNT_0006524453 /DNA_START=140 /DNA_END=3523 /DNA_ORIENTATION=-